MSDQPIRVLLVDDHELIRSGLGAVIDLEDDMDVAQHHLGPGRARDVD